MFVYKLGMRTNRVPSIQELNRGGKREMAGYMCVNESDLVRLSMEHMLKLSANCSVRLRVRVRECDSVLPSIKIHEDL